MAHSTKKSGIFSRKLIGEPIVPPTVKFLVQIKLFRNQLLAGYFLVGLASFAFISSLAIFYMTFAESGGFDSESRTVLIKSSKYK